MDEQSGYSLGMKSFFISVISFVFLFGCDKDVTRISRFEYWSGKELVTCEDVFVVDYGESKELKAPGSSSAVPASVASYHARPTDWWNSPEWQDKFGGQRYEQYILPILGVVSKGTLLRVSKIVEKPDGSMGRFVTTTAMVESGPYAGQEFSIDFLCNNGWGSKPHPVPNPRYLRFRYEKDAKFARQAIPKGPAGALDTILDSIATDILAEYPEEAEVPVK